VRLALPLMPALAGLEVPVARVVVPPPVATSAPVAALARAAAQVAAAA